MQPISKGFYLGSIVGGLVGGTVLVGIGLAVMAGGDDAGGAIIAVAYIPIIYGAVVAAVLIYKIWAAIQGPTARTTPGKAVGFLFIPFFNFYWIFQAFWGWTKDYNALVAQKGVSAPRAPESLALTMCILTLVGIIPFVGYVAALINIILTIVFYNAAINGANALAAAPAAPAAPAVEEGAPPPLPEPPAQNI